MADKLKAGEYVGADGTRRCFPVYEDVVGMTTGNEGCVCNVADLRAAAASLTALADEREMEIVELCTDYRIVIGPQRRVVEHRFLVLAGDWGTLEGLVADAILNAYDAGRRDA